MRPGWTRTILPSLERGPNKRSYSNQVTSAELGDHPILYWSGALQGVTIIGGSPDLPDVSSANIAEWAAVLRYANGGASREETWSWQPQGWTRTILASQVEVVARRVDGGAAPRVAMTYGAALVEDTWQSDVLNFVVRTPTVVGSQPITQRVPQGIHEYRGWQSGNLGTLDLGWVNVVGTFNVAYSVAWSSIADWTPWPNFCNAVQFNNGGLAGICSVEVRA